MTRQSKRGNARNVESAVGWLLWMLGFSVAHLGDTEGFSDGPDILATTRFGDVLVIECTTGGLKDRHKMQKLLDRCDTVKDQLSRSGRSHSRVLPIMVTTRASDEVQNDVEEFHRNGVIVLTQDNLTNVIDRTLTPSDATANFDLLWTQMESELENLKTKRRKLDQTVLDVEKMKEDSDRLRR